MEETLAKVQDEVDDTVMIHEVIHYVLEISFCNSCPYVSAAHILL